MQKRILSLLGGAALAAMLMTGCGTDDTDDTTTNTPNEGVENQTDEDMNDVNKDDDMDMDMDNGDNAVDENVPGEADPTLDENQDDTILDDTKKDMEKEVK